MEGDSVFLVTQNLQITQALADLVLATLVDGTPAPVLDVNSKVALYQNGPTPTFGMILGAFTVCDFHGYAPVVLATVLGPTNLPGGRGIFQNVSFLQTTGTTTSQSALGMLLVDTTGLILYGAEQFATPVPFNVAGDNLDYTLILAPRSGWGGQASAA